MKRFQFAALFSLLGILTACTTVPTETHDGLVLKADSKVGTVYVKPDADLSVYNTFGLVPCQVAFRKNWLRDQNDNRVNLSSRVTQKDVDEIKSALAAQCDAFFKEALLMEPAYKLVETFNEGEQVLVLRPAIINLDINAPDVQSPGISRSYTTSAGEMTLVLEAVDATTGEVLVRAADRQRDNDAGYLQWTNSVTNKADADRMLRRWAKALRQGLDDARASNTAP